MPVQPPTNRNASLVTNQPAPTTIVQMVGGGPSSQRPASPPLGFLYFDTTLGSEIVWNGTIWRALVPTLAENVGYGPTTNRPNNPRPGFLYFDTTLQSELAWNGSAWVLIGPGSTPVSVPAAPSSLSASPVSASQVNLAWTDNANNEQGFSVEKSTDNVTFASIATVGPGVVSFSNTGLAASTLYYYRVRSFNSSGSSSYSNTASATTSAAPGSPPNAPSGLIATAASSSQVNLAWTDNGGSPQGFALERSTDGSSYSQFTTTFAGITSYSDTGLAASTLYYYRVRSFNSSGNSSYSLPASATTTAPPAATYTLVFSSFTSIGTFSENTPLINGFITHNAGIGSTVSIVAQAVAGALPPGVSLTIVDPTGAIISTSTTAGGESQLGTTVATALNGGYSVIVSKQGEQLVIQTTVNVAAGSVLFHNCSARSTIFGPVIFPPDGLGLTLTASSTSGTSAGLLFSEGTTNTPLSNPTYAWNLQGNQTNNPTTTAPGGNITAVGQAGATVFADVRLQIYSL